MLEKEVDYCSGSYGSEGEDGREGVLLSIEKYAQIRCNFSSLCIS